MTREERIAVLVAHQIKWIDDYYGGVTCMCGEDFYERYDHREDYAAHVADRLDPTKAAE